MFYVSRHNYKDEHPSFLTNRAEWGKMTAERDDEIFGKIPVDQSFLPVLYN